MLLFGFTKEMNSQAKVKTVSDGITYTTTGGGKRSVQIRQLVMTRPTANYFLQLLSIESIFSIYCVPNVFKKVVA